MNIFNFDLASLFKAPVVTIEEDIQLAPVDYEYKEMPGEYKEVDTNFQIILPDVEQEISIHQKMYDKATESVTTLSLDPLPNIGGSENLG
jgi:hypothetical protein